MTLTEQECQDTCEVTNDFLGFAYGSTSCHCYYDAGGLPADTPSGFSRNDENFGTGPVEGSFTPLDSNCFKYHPAGN